MLIVTLCALVALILALVVATGLFLETKRLRREMNRQYIEDTETFKDLLSKWEDASHHAAVLVVEKYELQAKLDDSNKNLAFVLGLQDGLDEDEKKELLLDIYRTEDPCLKVQPSSPEAPSSAQFSVSPQDLSGGSLVG